MNVEIEKKIQEGKKYYKESMEVGLANSELLAFFKNELFTTSYKKILIQPMEMCTMLGELTGSSDFSECYSSDMGMYGFDSPKKLI